MATLTFNLVVLTADEVSHTYLSWHTIRYWRQACIWLHFFDHREIVGSLSIAYRVACWVLCLNCGVVCDRHAKRLWIYTCWWSQRDWLVSFIILGVMPDIETVPSWLLNAVSLRLTGLILLHQDWSSLVLVFGHFLHVALQSLIVLRVRWSVVGGSLGCSSGSLVLFLLLEKQVSWRAELISVAIEIVVLRGIAGLPIVFLSLNQLTRTWGYDFNVRVLIGDFLVIVCSSRSIFLHALA